MRPDPIEPRPFLPHAGLPGAGLPHDRLARMAARRVFVALKNDFLLAVAHIDGERGRWLREQVRRAEEAEDLLLLRGHVFTGLAGADDGSRTQRRRLQRSLDSMFADSAQHSAQHSAFTAF